jgi:hypothetical protein
MTPDKRRGLPLGVPAGATQQPLGLAHGRAAKGRVSDQQRETGERRGDAREVDHCRDLGISGIGSGISGTATWKSPLVPGRRIPPA